MLTTAVLYVLVVVMALIIAGLVYHVDRLSATQRSHAEYLASLEASVRSNSDAAWRLDYSMSGLAHRVDELSDRNGLAKLCKAASDAKGEKERAA